MAGYAAWALAALCSVLLAADESSPTADQRIRVLQESLVAPCCWNESVATHRSPVAAEMRREIAQWVRQGRSDREILDVYVQRYGKRVLREPEGALRSWLYVIPVVAVGLGLALTLHVMRRLRRPQPSLSP
ncbi:MAG: cytochrome c-type biogenesis protein [Bryobacterales bacterium]|nr:cytochrome c-type biogenesis protein CcmH [Bryobacteraceae bacterium]MDW8353820.1 cytochrome c-type biogenesis protein [Bryobacterales bacterium]